MPATIVPGRAHFYTRDAAGAIVNAGFVDNSYKWAGGGFLSTAEDLVTFANVLLEGRLLRPETLRLLWTSQKTNDGKETEYGIGWDVGHDAKGRRRIAHSGGAQGGTAYLLIYPDERLVAAMIVNSDESFTGQTRRIAEMFLRRRVSRMATEARSGSGYVALHFGRGRGRRIPLRLRHRRHQRHGRRAGAALPGRSRAARVRGRLGAARLGRRGAHRRPGRRPRGPRPGDEADGAALRRELDRLGHRADALGLLGVALPRRHRRRRRERDRPGLHRRGRAARACGDGSGRCSSWRSSSASSWRSESTTSSPTRPALPTRRSGSACRRGAGCSGSRSSRRSSTASAPSSSPSLRGTSSRPAGRRTRRRS